jgi:hypothetical protein
MAARKMQVDNNLQNRSLLVIMAARIMQADNILQNCFLLLLFLRMVVAHEVVQVFNKKIEQKKCAEPKICRSLVLFLSMNAFFRVLSVGEYKFNCL